MAAWPCHAFSFSYLGYQTRKTSLSGQIGRGMSQAEFLKGFNSLLVQAWPCAARYRISHLHNWH